MDDPRGARPDSRETWLRAGQQLLRDRGPSGVKLHALTDLAGRTTGSFYHHFSGMADYTEQLARYYGREQVEPALGEIDESDPTARLRRIADLARDRQMRPLDAAMRDWAGSYPPAAEAVREADETLLGYMADAFAALGFSTGDARTRATVFLAVGVARIHLPWRLPASAPEDVLALVTRPAG